MREIVVNKHLYTKNQLRLVPTRFETEELLLRIRLKTGVISAVTLKNNGAEQDTHRLSYCRCRIAGLQA